MPRESLTLRARLLSWKPCFRDEGSPAATVPREAIDMMLEDMEAAAVEIEALQNALEIALEQAAGLLVRDALK